MNADAVLLFFGFYMAINAVEIMAGAQASMPALGLAGLAAIPLYLGQSRVLLAGTIPLLGIIVEHFQTRNIKQQFNV